MLKKITFVLVATLVIASGLLCLSCDDGEDPAMAMLQQSQTSSTPPPAATPVETPAETPAPATETAEAPVEGEVTDAAEGEAVEGEAAEGEAAVAAEGDEAPAGDDAVAEEEAPAADEAGEAVEGDEAPAEGEAVEGEEAPAEGEAVEVEEAPAEGEAVEGEEAPVEETAAEEIALGTPEGEEGFIEDGAPVSDDPIENFKAMDPRDIIVKKYEDMEGRKTEPWNEEDPENFIPETGRPDPMTRVFDSVPSALKPPRAGETDQNEINDYLIANEATIIVQQIAASLQCDNVIQIGLDKYATFSIGGGRQFLLAEGDRTGQTVGSSTGIPIQITIAVSSITTDTVVVSINAAGVGTTTSVGKTLVYIPANQY